MSCVAIVKLSYLKRTKMVTWRTLVWLCMIFMVWPVFEPMKMGLLGVL